jgi:BlaI family transcriptional regulator, penicillinase repressor
VKPKKPVLTDLELEVMKSVWRHGETTVRGVYEDLAKQRKIAYTTVLTIMGILEQKGHLKKTAADRAYVYRPAQPQSAVVGSMVKDFVNRVFSGSAKPLIVHLAENREISQEDLDEISKLLAERKKR